MEFKTHYTKEDADELLRWFDTEPSGSCDLGNGVVVKDVSYYIQQVRKTVERKYASSKYSGMMADLFLLKEKMEKK